MNEPSKRMTSWRYNGDSRMKKNGEHCRAKEKSRGANINVFPAW